MNTEREWFKTCLKNNPKALKNYSIILSIIEAIFLINKSALSCH